jgi:hypothetical protein
MEVDIMFGFRIIKREDGTEIIDSNLKTPYNSLTAMQMVEYVEVDNYLHTIERQKRKARKQAESKRKTASNPLYRFAYMCGII